MTTSTDFESQLDDNPADWTLRLVYADWLEEQGNPRADSQRWMVDNGKCPQFIRPRKGNSFTYSRWSWWWTAGPSCSNIPFIMGFMSRKHRKTRTAAEIDLHNALVKAGEITCALIEEVSA